MYIDLVDRTWETYKASGELANNTLVTHGTLLVLVVTHRFVLLCHSAIINYILDREHIAFNDWKSFSEFFAIKLAVSLGEVWRNCEHQNTAFMPSSSRLYLESFASLSSWTILMEHLPQVWYKSSIVSYDC